jgi:hypothetical protein
MGDRPEAAEVGAWEKSIARQGPPSHSVGQLALAALEIDPGDVVHFECEEVSGVS